MRGLHWFRADLRLADNTALDAALQRCDSLLAVYILTPGTWLEHDDAPCKIQFILNNLKILSQECRDIGIPLLIRRCDTFSECASVLKKLCEEFKIDTMLFNKQYELNEMRRDQLVVKTLSKHVKIESFDDQLIMPPGTVLSQQDKPFQIFTPFKKVWLKKVAEHEAWKPIKPSQKKFSLLVQPDDIPNELKEFQCSINLDAWPAGEAAAQKQLKHFCEEKLSFYQDQRDFPSIEGTSQLSPYLAQGVLCPSQCIEAILSAREIDSFEAVQKKPGPATWLSELIWREFYKHILFFHPEVCQHKPFKENTDKLPWSYDEKTFKAWCEGRTGFPLVDAAMRQLNQTGWMHNRLRMVVAMFLSKTLFLDWRLGEKYFMQHLIDGDLAANNGGWQWSASTGTDAVPYFRIFNPITQSQRFDPEGDFIRQYCPELASLDKKAIHQPYLKETEGLQLNYPNPIVNYQAMRKKVIAAFKALS